MMISLSKRSIFIVLLAVNGLFIGAGFAMICLGIYKNITSSKVVEEYDTSSMADGTVNIVAGSLDILVGTCGLAGTLLRKRILLIVNVGVLVVVLIGNVVMMISVPIGANMVIREATANMKEAMISQYGNYSDTDSYKFTLSVDKYQLVGGCCGWSGLDGENLYLKTPWYRDINKNAPPGDHRTLPDTCCIRADANCRTASDVKAARDNGAVFELDCMDKQNSRITVFIWTSVTQLILVSLLQIAVVVFNLLIILHKTAFALKE